MLIDFYSFIDRRNSNVKSKIGSCVFSFLYLFYILVFLLFWVMKLLFELHELHSTVIYVLIVWTLSKLSQLFLHELFLSLNQLH